MKSKEGVTLEFAKVMASTEKLLSELGIPLTDCKFVVRIDGRPNESQFEVLIGLSLIHDGNEVLLPGGCSCIPIGLYEGSESFVQLERNALPIMESVKEYVLHKLGSVDNLYFGADLALFWTICEQKGVCLKCSTVTPAERYLRLGGCLTINEGNCFTFWIQKYIPCLLHAKLRIFSHFLEQMFQRCYGSIYWYPRFVYSLRSIGLRWQVYENKDNMERLRIPSYKGAEIDKIMLNLEKIIFESVAPDTSIQKDWDAKNLQQ